MDILSHALINNLVYQDLPIGPRWWSIAFGVLPDLISFSSVYNIEFLKKVLFFKKIPHSYIPARVFQVYKFTHSLIFWSLVFVIFWFFGSHDMMIAWTGWLLHIFIDIFTHSAKSFPTKIFWPLSNWHYSGMTWSTKRFLIIQYSLLVIAYIIFYGVTGGRGMFST